MKVAIYIRVSSVKKVSKPEVREKESDKFTQNPEVQLGPLRKICDARGWDIYKVYEDRISGAKKREDRPAYKALWKDAQAGEFNAILVWRLDRFARSTRELLNSIEELKERKIDFVSSKEQIDTSTASGKLMFTVMAAFAEFERDLIQERINAGIEHAREHGTKTGNRFGRPLKVFDREKAREMFAKGMSKKAIARVLGVSRATIMRITDGGTGEGVQKPDALKGALEG